jgi:hypothetical protein
MKKYVLLLLIVVSYVFPKDISPVLSVRYDNLDGQPIAVSDAIGLKFDLGNGRYSGFDTDGSDYRIYVGWGWGKIGMGHGGGTTAEYSIGANYGLVDNISLDLDYVMHDSGDDDNLRFGLSISF